MYDTYSTELPGPRVRAPRPQVPLVRIGVGLLPAPGRRREHGAEHAQIEFPEPGPLLEAARTQDDRREEDAEVREVEHDALGRVAPDVLLVAHGSRLQAGLRFSRGALPSFAARVQVLSLRRRSSRCVLRSVCGAVCGVAVAWRITVQLFEVRCLQLPCADGVAACRIASQRYAADLCRTNATLWCLWLQPLALGAQALAFVAEHHAN